MNWARVAVAAILSLVATHAFAQGDLLSRAPMREWVSWIKELRPARDPYPISPYVRMTADQWATERVYVLLFRLTQQCEPLGYSIDTHPFMDTVAGLRGWTGLSIIPGHPDVNRGKSILSAFDAAFDQHGQVLCAAFHRRLGRNGDLVAPLRRFTANNKIEYRYNDIVMWSDADICQHPQEFWMSDWSNPKLRSELDQLRNELCSKAAQTPVKR